MAAPPRLQRNSYPPAPERAAPGRGAAPGSREVRALRRVARVASVKKAQYAWRVAAHASRAARRMSVRRILARGGGREKEMSRCFSGAEHTPLLLGPSQAGVGKTRRKKPSGGTWRRKPTATQAMAAPECNGYKVVEEEMVQRRNAGTAVKGQRPAPAAQGEPGGKEHEVESVLTEMARQRGMKQRARKAVNVAAYEENNNAATRNSRYVDSGTTCRRQHSKHRARINLRQCVGSEWAPGNAIRLPSPR